MNEEKKNHTPVPCSDETMKEVTGGTGIDIGGMIGIDPLKADIEAEAQKARTGYEFVQEWLGVNEWPDEIRMTECPCCRHLILPVVFSFKNPDMSLVCQWCNQNMAEEQMRLYRLYNKSK